MLKKGYVLIILIMFSSGILLAQTNQEGFLGVWNLKDRSASIKIESDNGECYITEFTDLKYELFFSPDNMRVMFFAWGKGEPHPVIMKLGNGILTQYTLSEALEWIPGMVFHKVK